MKAPAATFDPEPYRRELLLFVHRLGHGGEADDLVQEVFLRALAHPPGSAPRAWLYRVALNLVRDRGRALERAPRLLERTARFRSASFVPRDPSNRAEVRDTVRQAHEVLIALPARRRAALILRTALSWDYEEIGGALGCSAAAARQHVHLAVKAVRDHVFAEKKR